MSRNLIDKKQKLLLELMMSNRDIFIKCLRIVKPSFFAKPLDRVLEFAYEYFEKHNGIPKPNMIEVETDIELSIQSIEKHEEDYLLEEIELFCREQAAIAAVNLSLDHIDNHDIESVLEEFRKVLLIKIDDSVGINIFDDPEERVRNTDLASDERSIGIPELDIMTGKIRRKELGVVYGTSGAGKSVTLANISNWLSKDGLHGLIISLELNETLYAKRLDAIITKHDIAEHKKYAKAIAETYDKIRDTYGNIVTKYMPYGTTPLQIRTVVMEYIIKYGRAPDYLIVDYLALMGVDGVSLKMSSDKFSMDEMKSFGLRNIAAEFDMYGFTAGQINREGQDVMKPTASHVAGGISAVNASDWSIAMAADDEMIDNNEFNVVQLKVRNGGKTRKPITLYRNPMTLEIAAEPFLVSRNPVKREAPAEEESSQPKSKSRDRIKSMLSKK